MRICEWCSKEFGDERAPQAVTCSDPCSIERHKAYQRGWQRQRYEKREALPPKPCARCSENFVPYRNNNVYCSRRCQWNSKPTALRPRVRPCSKCGVDTPTKPGTPVCADCKVDARDATKARARDQRLRLNLYGLTQEQYDDMLAAQLGQCAICQTDQPGRKGWAIDHCHETGLVRGILCNSCNLGLGLFRDSGDALLSAALYLEKVA